MRTTAGVGLKDNTATPHIDVAEAGDMNKRPNGNAISPLNLTERIDPSALVNPDFTWRNQDTGFVNHPVASQ